MSDLASADGVSDLASADWESGWESGWESDWESDWASSNWQGNSRLWNYIF